jgi:streptomycin 3"-adenylyltransferase
MGPWPQAVRAQLEELQRGLLDLLGESLVGVYLHGSLAMGCFNPARSDLDLLAVTEHPMSAETKRNIAELLLRVSSQHRPIEISFLSERDLHPWRYPTPFDFHYGEAHRAELERELQSERWRTWNDHRPTDPDLAAHITVTRERGIRLHGCHILEVFPEVPRADYLESIVQDFHWAKERLSENPVYFILNACRVLAYLEENRITSKAQAGDWAASALPERLCQIVTTALEVYRGDREEAAFDPEVLAEFAAYMERQVKAPAAQEEC